MTMELTIARSSQRLCRCKDPWRRHDGFVWGVPPDGTVHRAQFIEGKQVIGQPERSEQSGDLSKRL